MKNNHLLNTQQTQRILNNKSPYKRYTKPLNKDLLNDDVIYIEQKYKYSQTDLIGKGFSSEVYKGSDIDGQSKKYAIKVMNLAKIRGFMLSLLKREIKIHLSLKHQNIVKCYDAIQTQQKIYLILQFCSGGELSDFMAHRKKITQADSLKIMNQVVQGYKYLIKNDILHRDLKPCNILKSGSKWKIADFGFAIKSNQIDNLNVGTPIYMPPQALERSKYSHQSDFFSLGVIMHEIVYGKVPWFSKSQAQLKKKMSVQKIDLEKQKFVANPKIKRFILKCCQIEIDKRITIEQFLSFELFPQMFKHVVVDGEIEESSKNNHLKHHLKNHLKHHHQQHNDQKVRSSHPLSSSSSKKLIQIKKIKNKIIQGGRNSSINILQVSQNSQKSKSKSKILNKDNNLTTTITTTPKTTTTKNQQYFSLNFNPIKYNNQYLLQQQIQLCKHIYYMIKNINFFYLQEENKQFLSVVLYKQIIYKLKSLKEIKSINGINGINGINVINGINDSNSNPNPNYKSKYYFAILQEISINLNLAQKQYLDYLKHKDIKVLRNVNLRFPELSMNCWNGSNVNSFYTNIKVFVKQLCQEFIKNLLEEDNKSCCQQTSQNIAKQQISKTTSTTTSTTRNQLNCFNNNNNTIITNLNKHQNNNRSKSKTYKSTQRQKQHSLIKRQSLSKQNIQLKRNNKLFQKDIILLNGDNNINNQRKSQSLSQSQSSSFVKRSSALKVSKIDGLKQQANPQQHRNIKSAKMNRNFINDKSDKQVDQIKIGTMVQISQYYQQQQQFQQQNKKVIKKESFNQTNSLNNCNNNDYNIISPKNKLIKVQKNEQQQQQQQRQQQFCKALSNISPPVLQSLQSLYRYYCIMIYEQKVYQYNCQQQKHQQQQQQFNQINSANKIHQKLLSTSTTATNTKTTTKLNQNNLIINQYQHLCLLKDYLDTKIKPYQINNLLINQFKDVK